MTSFFRILIQEQMFVNRGDLKEVYLNKKITQNNKGKGVTWTKVTHIISHLFKDFYKSSNFTSSPFVALTENPQSNFPHKIYCANRLS